MSFDLMRLLVPSPAQPPANGAGAAVQAAPEADVARFADMMLRVTPGQTVSQATTPPAQAAPVLPTAPAQVTSAQTLSVQTSPVLPVVQATDVDSGIPSVIAPHTNEATEVVTEAGVEDLAASTAPVQMPVRPRAQAPAPAAEATATPAPADKPATVSRRQPAHNIPANEEPVVRLTRTDAPEVPADIATPPITEAKAAEPKVDTPVAAPVTPAIETETPVAPVVTAPMQASPSQPVEVATAKAPVVASVKSEVPQSEQASSEVAAEAAAPRSRPSVSVTPARTVTGQGAAEPAASNPASLTADAAASDTVETATQTRKAARTAAAQMPVEPQMRLVSARGERAEQVIRAMTGATSQIHAHQTASPSSTAPQVTTAQTPSAQSQNLPQTESAPSGLQFVAAEPQTAGSASSSATTPSTAPASAQAPVQTQAQPAATSAMPAPVTSYMAQGSVETLHALSANIQKTLKDGQTRFAMELYPADLGRVDVRLSISGEGRVTAELVFDSAAVAEDFAGRQDDLRQQLAQTGLKLETDALSFRSRDDSGRDAPADQRQNGQQSTQQGNPQNSQQQAHDQSSQRHAHRAAAAHRATDAATPDPEFDLLATALSDSSSLRGRLALNVIV